MWTYGCVFLWVVQYFGKPNSIQYNSMQIIRQDKLSEFSLLSWTNLKYCKIAELKTWALWYNILYTYQEFQDNRNFKVVSRSVNHKTPVAKPGVIHDFTLVGIIESLRILSNNLTECLKTWKWMMISIKKLQGVCKHCWLVGSVTRKGWNWSTLVQWIEDMCIWLVLEISYPYRPKDLDLILPTYHEENLWTLLGEFLV